MILSYTKGVEVKKEITERIANIKRNTQIVVFQPCVPNSNKGLGAWSCIKQVQPDSSLLTRYTTTVLCDTICNDKAQLLIVITKEGLRLLRQTKNNSLNLCSIIQTVGSTGLVCLCYDELNVTRAETPTYHSKMARQF